MADEIERKWTAGEYAAHALSAMDAVAATEYKFPADWREQIAACERCQNFKNHPLMGGICDEHRRPLRARDEHDEWERRRVPSDRLRIARDALCEIVSREAHPQTEQQEGR